MGLVAVTVTAAPAYVTLAPMWRRCAVLCLVSGVVGLVFAGTVPAGLPSTLYFDRGWCATGPDPLDDSVLAAELERLRNRSWLEALLDEL